MAAPPDDLKEERFAREVSASVGPNTVSDQPTDVDTLGFKPYVEAVAAFLTHAETHPPLTLSVEGPWGSGKSSFMLQLQKRLQELGGKTVWFNAWRHDKEDELWAAFALDFTRKLSGKPLPWWKRWLLHLELSIRRFDFRRGWFQLAKFLVLAFLFLYISGSVVKLLSLPDSSFRQFLSPVPPPASGNSESKNPKVEEVLLSLLLRGGGAAGYLLLVFLIIRKVGDVIGNPLQIQLTKYMQDPKYEARAAFVETFHADFECFVKTFRTYASDCRIFVFVDDLDRCEVPKSAELMQALNLLISGSAPIFYILGLDREKIAAGLAAKHEKLLPYLCTSEIFAKESMGATGTEFGYTYLEKFIQLPFLVPQPAQKDVEKLLDSLTSQAAVGAAASSPTPAVDPGLLVSLSTDSPSVRDVVRMVAPSLDYNPRRLKQFVNLFRLRALLASQTGLFGSPRDERFGPFTFEQLGKLVAIILRWPLLLVDLEAKPDLLIVLQAYAWESAAVRAAEKSPGPVAEFWLSKRNLMELIAFPVTPGKPAEDFEKQQFGLHRIDVERFLQVSPLVKGREQFGTAPPTEAVSARDRRPNEPSHAQTSSARSYPASPEAANSSSPGIGEEYVASQSEVAAEEPSPVEKRPEVGHDRKSSPREVAMKK